MKTKRIERCDLSTLASKFEAIKDNEMLQYNGGDWYYNASGICLGQCGGGNEVRIVGGQDESTIRSAIENGTCSSEHDGLGSLFSESTDITAKTNIIKSLFPNYTGPVTAVGSLPNDAAMKLTCGTSSGNITSLSYDEESGYFDNYYQMMNMVDHEDDHFSTCGSGMSIDEQECHALWAQGYASSFKNAPIEWQQGIINKIVQYEKKTGNTSITHEQVRNSLGITDWDYIHY